MTLHFLGAGSAFSRSYGTTCSLLTLSSGKLWLIDCGRQAPDQLHAAGLSWHEIEGQLITHHHGDHSHGLEDFAFMRYYEGHHGLAPVLCGGPRPKLIAHSAVEAELAEGLAPSLRYIRLPNENSVDGTLDHYFEVLRAVSSEAPRDNPWPHIERFEADGLRLAARETVHVPEKPSCSFELNVSDDPSDDRIAWWSGDATVDASHLEAVSPRSTIFFHDCTFAEYPGQVHGAFKQLAALPQELREKMVLMHHDDDIEDHRDEVEAAGFRLAFPGDKFDLVTGKRI